MENTLVTPTPEPISKRIGPTVRRFRRERGLDLRELAELLAEEGHPLKLGQLSKLELGDRRVDVDDLVALAVVLNVTPSQLLMPEPPAEGEDQVVALTPHRRVGWHRAWQWMCGDYWVDDSASPSRGASDQEGEAEAEADWHFAARPHDPFGGYMFAPSYLYTREDDVRAVVHAVREAMTPKEGKNTLTRRWLFAAIDWYLTVETGKRETRKGPARG
ncbi:helix-turn-helix domain-containing protein [Modestobacter sp. SYSU DS0657]